MVAVVSGKIQPSPGSMGLDSRLLYFRVYLKLSVAVLSGWCEIIRKLHPCSTFYEFVRWCGVSPKTHSVGPHLAANEKSEFDKHSKCHRDKFPEMQFSQQQIYSLTFAFPWTGSPLSSLWILHCMLVLKWIGLRARQQSARVPGGRESTTVLSWSLPPHDWVMNCRHIRATEPSESEEQSLALQCIWPSKFTFSVRITMDVNGLFMTFEWPYRVLWSSISLQLHTTCWRCACK